MVTKRKSKQPERRMGVYKRLADVPERSRFERHVDAYDGRDVWQEFVDDQPDTFDSDHYHASFRKAGTSWKAHLKERGRHHALARPADVDTWCCALLETRTLGTVYKEYFVRVEQFYSWLQFRTDHPHVYHPVLMAANEFELTRRVWNMKFDDSSGGRDE